jgi:diguanylate cyclase (GGDEF)-like protein
VRIISAFCRALLQPHTWNLFRNPEAVFGLAWGLPIPAFSITLDILLVGAHESHVGRGILAVIREHPFHLFFLAHPPVFALIFGAMGTIRRDLELEKGRLIQRLEEQATTDPLTGAWNRRFVLEELQRGIARAERTGAPLAVAMFDMDNFKVVNDEQGHLAGDILLKDVAASMREALRKGDTLGRYGGDEFLLVAQGDLAAGQAVAERAESLVRARTSHSVTSGVAAYPADGKTPQALIGVADARLGARKRDRKTGRSSAPPRVGPPAP